MVWALYPETGLSSPAPQEKKNFSDDTVFFDDLLANRTLEEMDLLFASKSPFVWDEEESFRRLKAEMETNGKSIQDVVDGPDAKESVD